MSTETQSKPQSTPTAPEAVATVLVVDDEPNILRALRRLFRADGYRLLMAEGGAEGLKVLEQEAVDLVISDMRMPEMDGATFLKAVAERWPDVMRLLLTGYAEVDSAIAAINDGKIYRYLSKPWDDDDLRASVGSALEFQTLKRERQRLETLTHDQNEALTDLNANLEAKVADRTQALRTTLAKLEKTHHALNNSYVQSIQVFSRMIDLRSHSKVGARQVGEQAHQIALDLGLSQVQAQDVLFSALLSELGKIGFSDGLLNKPEATMTSEEKTRYQQYPVDGQAALMALAALQASALLIRTHREHMDGSGFPDGLSGDAIPIGARVLAVVSHFHALRGGRITRVPLSKGEACTILSSHRGSHFDPQVVDAYLARYGVAAKENIEEPDIHVDPGALTKGMVLSRDVLSADGMVWLPRGQVLDERLIARMQEIGKASIRPLQLYVRFKPMP